MGLMPAGATNPFTKVDQQTIFGMFKSTASHDPDVVERCGDVLHLEGGVVVGRDGGTAIGRHVAH